MLMVQTAFTSEQKQLHRPFMTGLTAPAWVAVG